LHPLDVIVSILIIIAAFRGYKKGFIISITGLVALIVGVYVAIYFSDWVATLMKEQWDIDIPLLSFVITFTLVIIGINLIGKGIEKIAKAVALGMVNKIAGMIFTASQMILIVTVALGVFLKINEKYTFIEEYSLNGSFLFPYLKDLETILFPYFQQLLV
jgi:membrane protein required for colicin V production